MNKLKLQLLQAETELQLQNADLKEFNQYLNDPTSLVMQLLGSLNARKLNCAQKLIKDIGSRYNIEIEKIQFVLLQVTLKLQTIVRRVETLILSLSSEVSV